MKTGNKARLRKPELFRLIGYKPHASQIPVHRSLASRRVVACGTRFGKSTIGVNEAIAALLEPRDTALGWLVCPTLDLTQRIFQGVAMSLHEHFKHRVLRFDQRERVIEIANLGGGRSELRAKTADNPTSLLGAALDFVIVDEAAKLRDNVWNDHLGPRLLDRNGWALLLSTPNGGGWFHQQFRRGARKLDPDYESWALPSVLNPFISAELIEAERTRLPERVFAAQYLAEFVNVPPEVCDTCHGPKVGAKCFILLVPGQELGHCPSCGELVNEDGETAVSLDPPGERVTTVVIRCEESPDPSTVPSPFEMPELPEYVHAVVLHKPLDVCPELPDGIE